MAASTEARSTAVASQTITEPQMLTGNAEASAHRNNIDVIISDTADPSNLQDD